MLLVPESGREMEDREEEEKEKEEEERLGSRETGKCWRKKMRENTSECKILPEGKGRTFFSYSSSYCLATLFFF